MKIAKTSHHGTGGWRAPLPAQLDSESTLVLAFGARERAGSAAFDELAAAFPRSVIVGCSTAGEIAGTDVDDDSIAVAIARFEHSRVRVAVAPVTQAAASAEAGRRLAAMLHAPDLRAVFVLSDGLCVNGTPLVAALVAQLGPGVVVSGGLAGDGARFERTWVLAEGRIDGSRVVAIGLYGDRLRVGHGCEGGWHDFGPQRRITRAEGNVLYELDGKPALDLYKAYLGTLAEKLPGSALLFPLSIRRPGSTERPLVRTILGIDEARRSMTFAGDMPVGHEARLMRGTDENLIGSAASAIESAIAGCPADGDRLVICVSCVGRRLMLGERTDEELRADGSGGRDAQIGFYSYGEISPSAPGQLADLHNQTMTVTALAEA